MKDICNECSFRGETYDPVLPKFTLPPVKIMFIGENPSWEPGLESPLAQNSISGQALDKYYLTPLKLLRNKVWITNLIKCRYPREEPFDVYHHKASHQSDIQDTANRCCNLWLIEEIKYAMPKIIVTLSDKEVYQRFRKIFDPKLPANFTDKAVGRSHDIVIDGMPFKLFPMVHPDISRPLPPGETWKKDSREKWSHLHREEHIPALMSLLAS